MGRSAPSCLKIITCATHSSVDTDPLQPSETKSSNDKKGWSFRKRSPKHRVVNNNVSSELSPSVDNKERQESATVDYGNLKADNSEKPSAAVVQCKEEIVPPLPTPVSSKLSDLIAATDHNKLDLSEEKLDLTDGKVDLPVEKVDLPVEKVDLPVEKVDLPEDKLDIPEDQPDLPEEKLNITDDKLDVSDENIDIPEETLDIVDDNENKESDVIVIQAAVRGFLVRRRLVKHKNAVKKLQAAVRGHLVRKHAIGTLRCVQAIVKMQALVRARQAPSILGKQNDGIKPDLNNPTIEKLLSNSFARQLMESTPKNKAVKIKCDPSRSDSAWKWLERWVSVSPAGSQRSREPKISAQTGESRTENEVEKELDLAVPFRTEETPAAEMQHDAKNIVEHNSDVSPPSEAFPSDSIGQIEHSSDDNCEPELSTVPIAENSNALEQAETEERKLVSFGSRKASNPAFIAAQSKFEELTSSTKSINSSNQDSCADEAVNPATDNAIKPTKEDDVMTDNSPLHNSRIQVEDSESGSHHPAEIVSAVQEEQQSEIINEKINKEVEEESVLVEDSEEKKEVEEYSFYPTEESFDVCKSPSPQEASPIVLESQGTPSSQASPQSKAKKNKKRKSLSAARRSPVKPSNDSSARSSFEKLPKEHSSSSKTNKKVDDEPKSSSSLPSYMQATESAKAKVHASSGSPRSGADVQEKDSSVKKRLSLPANGRHGSPQILRSKSQVATKGTDAQQSPQDKKWQR